MQHRRIRIWNRELVRIIVSIFVSFSVWRGCSALGRAFTGRNGGAAAPAGRPSSAASPHHRATKATAMPAAGAAAPSSSSFADFVAATARTRSRDALLVIGNPAGDADSIVSALALAYVDHLIGTRPPKAPVVSVPRADLALRRETVLLLEAVGISTSALTCLDDLSASATADAAMDAPGVVLVDHNKLLYDELEGCKVVEILDHHVDEKAHGDVAGDLRNIAFGDSSEALAGSTCTLVAERMFRARDSAPADLALALLGVILLDTANLSAGAGKGTERDRGAVAALVDATDWTGLAPHSEAAKEFLDPSGGLNTTRLYDFLSQSKFDASFWKSLTVRDALRLDYKQFTASNGSVFGASSVLLPLDDFMTKPGFETEVLQYMMHCNIPVLTIMGLVIVDDRPTRSMMLCGATDSSIADELAEHLKADATLDLSEKQECFPTPKLQLHVRVFDQGNSKASRKQVVPIILDFYENGKPK